jgi:hypothetical protein
MVLLKLASRRMKCLRIVPLHTRTSMCMSGNTNAAAPLSFLSLCKYTPVLPNNCSATKVIHTCKIDLKAWITNSPAPIRGVVQYSSDRVHVPTLSTPTRCTSSEHTRSLFFPNACIQGRATSVIMPISKIETSTHFSGANAIIPH